MLKTLRNLLIVGLLLLLQQKAFAGIEPYQNFIKGSLKPGDSLFVKDEKFKNPNFNWADINNISVNNHIKLSLYDENPINQSFSCNLKLRVEYFSSPEQVIATKIDSVTLNINYNKQPGATYKGSDTYSFNNGYYVKVYVISVSSPEYGTNLPQVLQLTNSIEIDRTYQFKPFSFSGMNGIVQSGNSSGGKQMRINSSSSSNGSQLSLSWGTIVGAQEYDIEWTTIDEDSEWETMASGLNSGSYTDDQIAQMFKNNATRITLSDNTYTISLLYSAKYIVVRMRQVAYVDGIRNEGPWLYKQDDNVTYAVWDLTWHQPSLNWQYSATYAEEGKRKEVMSYFDGTLRSRQSVTLNNEDKVAVVQENVYDQFGRAAASILPAPVKEGNDQSIHYFPAFNKSITGLPYSFVDLNEGNCEPLPNKLSNSTGAARYYSEENTFPRTLLYNNYIPKAFGYPIAVTQYTPDNTGRIKLQGGVGEMFQPGQTDKHTTRYFYGKPNQWELDRLFGNDVGYADHYLKNMVVDPNGQISISYLNAAGKTIATALTGAKPGNVDKLSSQGLEENIKANLLRPEQFSFSSSTLKLSATTTYMASVSGTATLDYSIEKLISRYPGGSWQPCSNCYYDLTITIRDNCNRPIFTTTTPTQIGSSTANINDTGLYTNHITATFDEIGEYYITFEFALSKDVITRFTNTYIAEGQVNGNIKKRSEFILNNLKRLNSEGKSLFEDCFADCSTAVEKLGTETAFTAMFKAKLAELGDATTFYDSFIHDLYISLYATASALKAGCATSYSPCDIYRQPMLLDVSPGGQYALVDEAGDLMELNTNVLALYFKHGAFNSLAKTHQTYLDNLITLENGDITSPYDSTFSLADLIKYWKPEWAELFLPFHPEYCKLLFCNQNSSSKIWDEQLAQKNASEVGYVYSNTTNWLLDTDPFFNGGAGADYKADFSADLSQYSSRVLNNQQSVKSLSQFVDFITYCGDPTGTTNSSTNTDTWTNCSPTLSCRVPDREWQTYMEMYLMRKAYYFAKVRKESLNCENSCEVGMPVTLGDGSTTTVNCTSITLTLGEKLNNTTFKETDNYNHVQRTHEFINGIEANEPIGSYNCANGTLTKQFYPCINVIVGQTSYRFSNVWKITCTENIPNNCNIQGSLSADGNSGLNQYYIISGGVQYNYTIYEGYDSEVQPIPSCNQNNITFYNCYTVIYNGVAHQYTNVWVNICTSSGGGGGGGGGSNCDEPVLSRAMESNVNVQELPPCEEVQQMRAANTDNTLLLADYQTSVIYSISKKEIKEPKANKSNDKIKFKKRFGNYVFKALFTVQDNKGSFRTYKNVWVAEYISQAGSLKARLKDLEAKVAIKKMAAQAQIKAQAKTTTANEGSTTQASAQKSTMQTALLPGQDCAASSDFIIADGFSTCQDPQTAEWGKQYTIRYYSGSNPVCTRQNFFVEVRVSYSNGMSQVVDYVQLDPATSSATICIPDIYLVGSTGIFICSNTTIPPCDIDPGGTSCDPIYSTKISRFEPTLAEGHSTNVNQYVANTQTSVAMQVSSSCTVNADSWMQKLAMGLAGYSEAVKTQLKNNLIELCSRGGDLNHPFGASTLPAGQYITVNGVQCTSFAEVIKNTLTPHGFTNFNNDLNPWLIDSPYPYDTPLQIDRPIISKADANFCAKLSALNVNGLSTAPAFHAYLVSTYGNAMTLTVDELQTLMNGCGNCKFVLAKDIALPLFMDPKAKGCISEADYFGAVYTQMPADFGPGLNVNAANYETIVANYLNHKFGFSFGYYRYYEYEQIGGQLCNEPIAEPIAEDPYACAKSLIEAAFNDAIFAYNAYIAEERNKFQDAYISTCAAAKATVDLETKQQIYHYTLYYYDLAGNLVRTVPPEGVTLLSDNDMLLVRRNREVSQESTCTYSGPTTVADETTALNKLSSALASTANNAIEMWLYTDANGSRQFISATPDMKYMVQACMNGNLVNVDIYSLNQTASDNVAITLSNHITANVSDILPLSPWTHLVVQGADLAKGTLQIWVNGKMYTPVAGAPTAGCGWAITAADPIVMPKNLTLLKHLRIYSGRLMTQAEIYANATSTCFNVADNTALDWYRFNLPPIGGPTTIAETSTNETQYNGIYPLHGLTTTYAYNATNQVIKQNTPDAGTSLFWYDLLSRLVISQNAKQANNNDFSYTKYDDLGRITEVGQKNIPNSSMGEPRYLNSTELNNFTNIAGTKREITETYYDVIPSLNTVPNNLQNLRKRVAASVYRETAGSTNYNATYYSYDLAGNVKNLYQWIDGLGSTKKLNYEYDLVSGKVNFLAYQHESPDQFYYSYKYDAENRLIAAWSSIQANIDSKGFGSKLDESYKKLDATYQYYLHGPLARIELGDQGRKVQGIDYAYTLQGWLKGVNGTALNNPATDLGNDGATIAKDALAFSLGYYHGDYQPIGASANAFGHVYQANNGDVTGRSLYNGNISNSTYAIAQINGGATTGYTYNYDQLHRLLNLWQHPNIGTTWSIADKQNNFAETFSYDGNGNILSLSRKKQDGNGMDQLTYAYENINGRLLNNKLSAVTDALGKVSGNDMSSSAYTYDAIGNLLSDTEAGITSIDWNVYGKIKQINKASGNISYAYDPAGNRVSKTANNLSTYYVRDAQGNQLAVYEKTGGVTTWKEQQLYGSSRLGMWRPDVNLATLNGSSIAWAIDGLKSYELSNHLGNVMAVVTDNRTLNGSVYEPVVVNAQDYYAFGGQMPNRSFNLGGGYRYGFNGKENDNEVKGQGNQQDYGMRIYDPRIAKFLSVDPITAKYPELTPYQFASNTPIWAIDLDGLEAWTSNSGQTVYGPLSLDYAKSNNLTSSSGEQSLRSPFINPSIKNWEYHEPWENKTQFINKALLFDKASRDFESIGQILLSISDPILEQTSIGKAEGVGAWIPVYNDTRDGINAYQNGQYLRAAGNGALAITSAIGLKSLATSVFKGSSTLVEQYALRASEDGFYPVMTRGFAQPTELVWLNKGDVWKFGTTKNPFTRYSTTFLENTGSGLYYSTEFTGTLNEVKVLERMKIMNFQFQNGILPAGNKIIR